jgi:hypothetical protein
VSSIQSLPADKHALYNIRFRFKVDSIWTIITINHPELKLNDFSKDITLDPIVAHHLTIKVTIHHTNTVSVIVACSLNLIICDCVVSLNIAYGNNSCRASANHIISELANQSEVYKNFIDSKMANRRVLDMQE